MVRPTTHEAHEYEAHDIPATIEAWEWQRHGNCAGMDTSIFFLPDGKGHANTLRKRERIAKDICEGCPVVVECLEHALRVPERHGVWGGLSADERKPLMRK